MGERWVSIILTEHETLRCELCGTYMYEQRMHLYLDVDDEIDEVLCDTCWKKNQKEISK